MALQEHKSLADAVNVRLCSIWSRYVKQVCDRTTVSDEFAAGLGHSAH